MSVFTLAPKKEAALAMASLGLHVFPCNPDKTPKVATGQQASASPSISP
jgi:hypothetical protein